MSTFKKDSNKSVAIPNNVIEDSRLSFDALGLYMFLCSMPDGWEVSAERIADLNPADDISTIRRALCELKEAGYLTDDKEEN